MAVPSLSIVVPTHDTRVLTLRCLSSLGHGGVVPTEVIVVDDASSDGTAEAIAAEGEGCTLVETGDNVGFSRAVNLGAERTTGEIILVLNSDTEVLEGGLSALVAAFSDQASFGIAGAELLDPGGAPQWRAGSWPTRKWLFTQASGLGAVTGRIPGRRALAPSGATRAGEVDWVSGAAMAVRREVWDDCGPFDTDYRFYCQDLDLCRAAHAAGWTTAVVPGFRVLHHHGATISATAGASGSFHPAHLWADLVRFTAKYDGNGAASRAARALRAGARLRLLGRSLSKPFATDRTAFDRDTRAFRDGLAALDLR